MFHRDNLPCLGWPDVLAYVAQSWIQAYYSAFCPGYVPNFLKLSQISQLCSSLKSGRTLNWSSLIIFLVFWNLRTALSLQGVSTRHVINNIMSKGFVEKYFHLTISCSQMHPNEDMVEDFQHYYQMKGISLIFEKIKTLVKEISIVVFCLTSYVQV